MSTQLKRARFVIHENHVIYPDEGAAQHPRTDDLSLDRFCDLVLRWNSYRNYFLCTHKIEMVKGSDYDGSPFEDMYCFYYDAKRGKPSSSYKEASITIMFHDVGDDEDKYDYTDMVARSMSTAYKMRTGSPPRKTKFRIFSVSILHRGGDADVWIRGEVVRLRGILDALDKATKNLLSWAESDFGMQVFCPTPRCRERVSIIPSRQLLDYAEKGLSIDELKERLKCKVCGGRCSGIWPA